MPLNKDALQTAEPLPAGRYWVGDPCYAFDQSAGADDLWGEWLKDAWSAYDGPAGGVPRINDGTVRGMRIAAVGTQWGDGDYPSSEDFSCPVDAGLVGAVHESFTAALMGGGTPNGMTLVDFPEPFWLSYEPESGRIDIGHVSVFTGWDEDEDDDEGDDDDEW